MSFRARLTIAAASAVALAIVLAAPLVYVIVRGELRKPIDDSLKQSAAQLSHLPPDDIGRVFYGHGPGPHLEGSIVYPQIVDSQGNVLRGRADRVGIPIDKRVKSVASGTHGGYLTDAHVGDTHVRVYTFQYTPGLAIQVARVLTEVDDALARIRTFLILVAACGIALAAALGLLVSRAALAPVRRLTRATETVAETGDLSERIEVTGSDELSRLAMQFNTMLEALERSARAQRQLVADASHELRTPLTTIRGFAELYRQGAARAPEQTAGLLRRIEDEAARMGLLVEDLLLLARLDRERPLSLAPVELPVLAGDAVQAARAVAPDRRIELEIEPGSGQLVVYGDDARLRQVIGNLMANALTHTPPEASVTLRLRTEPGNLAVVEVADTGPGLSPEQAERVFERFYRADAARTRRASGMTSTGLGLAIVAALVTAHHGMVEVAQTPGGGATFRVRLPLAPDTHGEGE